MIHSISRQFGVGAAPLSSPREESRPETSGPDPSIGDVASQSAVAEASAATPTTLPLNLARAVGAPSTTVSAEQAQLAQLLRRLRERWTPGLAEGLETKLSGQRLPDVWARDLWSLGRAALAVLRNRPEPSEELLELLVGVHEWLTDTGDQQSRVWRLARGPFSWAVVAAVVRASQRVLGELASQALGSSPCAGRFTEPAGQLLLETKDWVGCAARWHRSLHGWEGRLIEVYPGQILLWWESSSDRGGRPGVLKAEPEEWGYALQLWPASPEIEAQTQASFALEEALFGHGVCDLVVPCARLIQARRDRKAYWVDLRCISGPTLENRLQTRWSGADELLEPLDAIVSLFRLARQAEQADLDLAFRAVEIVRWQAPQGAPAEWRLRDLIRVAMDPVKLSAEPSAAVRMTRRCAELVLRIWNSVGWTRHGTAEDKAHLLVTGRGRWVQMAPGALESADALFSELLAATTLSALAAAGEGFQALAQRWRKGEIQVLDSRSTLMVCPPLLPPSPLEGLPISPGRFPEVLTWADQLLSVWCSHDSASYGFDHLRAWMEAIPQASGCKLLWVEKEPLLLVKRLAQHRHTEAWAALRIQRSRLVPVFVKSRIDQASSGHARRLHESCQFQNWLAEQHPSLTPQVLLLDWMPQPDQCVAVMPWVGSSLASAASQLQAQSPNQQLRQLVSWADQLLDHLEVLQRLGIVHGDIKPDNIVVGPDGRLMLIDWELTPSPLAFNPSQSELDHSQWTTQSLYSVRTGQLSGTPPYIGESAWTHGNGASDARADCYAVALSLLSLVPGVPASLTAFYNLLSKLGSQGLRSSIRNGLLHGAYQAFDVSIRVAARASLGKDPDARKWLEAMRFLLKTDFDEHGGVPEARKVLAEFYGDMLRPAPEEGAAESSSLDEQSPLSCEPDVSATVPDVLAEESPAVTDSETRSEPVEEASPDLLLAEAQAARPAIGRETSQPSKGFPELEECDPPRRCCPLL